MPYLPLPRLARGATAIALLACLAAMPAQAQRFSSKGPVPDDPVIAGSEQDAGPSHFFINDERDVEIIRFRTPRDVEMCAGPAKRDEDGLLHQFPIKVSWDTQTAVITAGNCLSFDAQRVTVRSAARLPEDMVLEGTYRVKK